MELTTDFYNKYAGKRVNILLIEDGGNVVGILDGWTSEADNEPDGESIFVKTDTALIEVYIREIKSITAA